MGCGSTASGHSVTCWHSTIDGLGQNFAARRQLDLDIGPRSVDREIYLGLFRLLSIWALESSKVYLLFGARLLLSLVCHIFEGRYLHASFTDALVGLLFRFFALNRRIEIHGLQISCSNNLLILLSFGDFYRFLHVIA